MQHNQRSRVTRLATADEFLSLTEQLRAADPFRTNLMGSVASSVASGARTYESYFWWILLDDLGAVVGAAIRTAPHGMILSPMAPALTQVLATAVIKADVELPGVAGSTSVVNAFVDAYTAICGRDDTNLIRKVGRELLYALGQLVIPDVQGEMEVASQVDYETLSAWYIDFGSEAGLLMPNPAASIADGFARNSWRFWKVNNQVVSMAGHAALVEVPGGTVGRIGPVFTPKNQRRKGYAAALTAHLARELMEQGAQVMLYTDALNPTSNSVYQRIGFELIDENTRYEFCEPGC